MDILFPNIFSPGELSIYWALTLDQNSREVHLQVNILIWHLDRHQSLLLPANEKLSIGKHIDFYQRDFFFQNWLRITLPRLKVRFIYPLVQ